MMSLEMILIIALAVIGVTEIIFICCFLSMRSQINELKADQKLYDRLMKLNNEMIGKIEETVENQGHHYELLSKLFVNYGEQFDNIVEGHKALLACYETISDHYKRLLETWKGIDERYDHAYEQFKYCTDTLHLMENNILAEIVERADDIKCLIEPDLRHLKAKNKSAEDKTEPLEDNERMENIVSTWYS